MAKMTIAQLREREIDRLVSFKTNSPDENDFSQARRMMNSFYRLCGLCERNLYLANDERTCDRYSTKESEERESAWSKRLDGEFNRVYGLRLFYSGYMPSIGTINEHGGCAEKITRWFYQ